jgi:spermidine synthase
MEPAPVTQAQALVLSAASGFIALSFELLWYRAYAIALMARPQAFGVLLGGYLAGIAAGAWCAHRACRHQPAPRRAARRLSWTLGAAALAGALLVPVFARFVSVSRHWEIAVLLVAVASAGLGAILPLTAAACDAGPERAGTVSAHLYAANILGSVAGTVLTGFVLMDRWSLAGLLTAASTGELALATWIAAIGSGRRQAWRVAAATMVVVAGVWAARDALYARTFERLFFRMEFSPAKEFRELVENRSGVIGVTSDGAVFGSGVYDGMYNVQLRRAGENFIHRAFAVAALHPAPREVLLIGLSSGSWAAVIANLPGVERVTIVEINPGYLQLLPRHVPSNGLLADPRVHIEIDDGRHWLRRHPDRRFDVIVANTTYHWRAEASNLLSVEFLSLVRRHLNGGGVYYYNATGQPRAERTGVEVFPFGWRLYNMMAVSDAPIEPDLKRLDAVMRDVQVYGTRPLDPQSPEDAHLRAVIVEDIARDLEPRARIVSRTMSAALITDDNMGTEWQMPARYHF